MAIEDKKPRPERERTDEGLRTEREKTDQAMIANQAEVEGKADTQVLSARRSADAVLIASRDRADERLAPLAPSAAPHATVAQERVLEDETLRAARASEDERRRQEHEESFDALSKLLPLEREKTDRYLLTERARSDAAVANRDDFLGMVSHDLRSLLGGIVLSAGLLDKRAPEGDAGKQTRAETGRVQRYAARMNRLIGDLVDVASIDAGQLALTRIRGDATALIAEAVDLFRDAASAEGIALEAEPAEGPLPAEFDHDRMLQVFANLITNAIKFSPQGGHIRIRGEHTATGLRFAVRDDGPGIPSPMLEAVFERFWQVQKNDRRGLGLGLYISRSIVEAHGGKIWAESTLGEGSTFWITLPAA